MRFVDLAIDLAAVLNASRSVASKHVALRGRQLDVYSRASGVAALLKKNRAAAERSGTAQVERDPGDANGAAEKREEGGTAGVVETADRTRPQQPAISPDDGARESGAAEAEIKVDVGQSPISPFSGDDVLRSRMAAQQPTTLTTTTPTTTTTTTREQSDDLDLPPGIDVNIFHTARGSKILDSLRKQNGVEETRGSRVGGPAKEHPLRHWPRPPPVEPVNIPPIAAEAESNAIDIKASEPEPIEPPSSETSNPVEAAPPQPSQLAPEVVSDVTSKADDERAEIVTESAVAEPPATSAPISYQLRESKVPATRFSRLLNYGGLAAGMLGGAVTESVSRALGGGGQGSVLLSGSNMERLVAKLSRMRGAALKLGQMMSFQDAKMLPGPIQEVLQRVQDRADYMPAWQRDRVLASNLGADWRELFSEFDEKPIAAASIGQVHKAVLKSNGRRVAVKIQFPGVADSINSDLDNLGMLLTATKLLPRGLYLNKTIDNARLELGWECDYEREAECARRYKELLLRGEEEDVFVAPGVYPEASGKQVLTMDFLDGVGVTRVKSFTQEQRDWIGTQLLRLCWREITEFRFMQTDPNWSNFLYNAESNRLELLDFGASREYPEEFVSQYVQLLEAASRSDRDGVKRFSEALGYLTGHESRAMLDAHVQSVVTLAEPFCASAPEVYDFKDQTVTERVKALIPVMLHERLTPPPEETYSLHRKLSGAFLLCAKLESRVRCRELFMGSVTKSGYVKNA